MLAWFDLHQRPLPWRASRDPYAIWISEVMLQQTQVATVIPFWERFLARFPTVKALAAAPLTEVLSQWRGLGYYSRARNLHRAAQEIALLPDGALPSSAAALQALPGFGRYTAGAVASIAFGEQAPLVDGNVARVFARLFEVEGAPGDRAREARLWELAEGLVAGERPGDWNQALMELGALLCRSDAPLCLLCPVRRHCGASATGRVDQLPPKRVRTPRKQLELAVGVWRKGGAFLLGRREAKGLFGGLWELPTAEVSLDGPAQTLRKTFGGEVGEALGTVRRTLTHRELSLTLFKMKGAPPNRSATGYVELRWASPKEAESLGMSTAMQHALAAAAEKL